ncbi:MFS transporter [Hyalangium versicolor]|uniref:MFS transporter n=1 Tax=Hyalangium versicolor TaxID=2861190 RepID=UPI001CCC058B|nr:MFS transporter [Hyalangium versicolor]
MLASLSPQKRLLIASGLILGLAVVAPLGGLSSSGAARWLLGAGVLVGLGAWLWSRGAAGPRFTLPERLRVVSRAGLSQRCGLALVEMDGRSFLVAFGDSFAEIHPAPALRPALAQARGSGLRRRGPQRLRGAVR